MIKNYHIDTALVALLLIILGIHFLDFIDTPILITATIIGFLPVIYGVYRSFRKGEWASMDLLASVALIFSLISQQWASAVFIELMLAAARILEEVTSDRTEKSIRGLLKLRPRTAKIERDGAIIRIAVEDVRVGDIVIVDIEERIPIDGIVLSGNAAVDESSLTGESIPIDKDKGDKVMSATLVKSGSLHIQTTQIGKETALERIIALVESARAEKPSSQTIGEKFGKLYLVTIFVGSALLYFFTRDLLLVLSVVLVVCADDIAVAVPVAYLRAIRAAAHIGVIVKGSKHLEALGNVKTIVFDKTGTLTTGTLSVTRIIPVGTYTEEEVLRWSTCADMRSTHPLSRAIIAYAKERGIESITPDNIEEKGGRGIIATYRTDTIISGKEIFLKEQNVAISSDLIPKVQEQASLGQSISYVALNGNVIGCIAAADTIKGNAHESIQELCSLGVRKIVMLTGDNNYTAEAISRQIGITEWHANLLPEDKVSTIARLQKEGPVAMIGDGVNDAAALSIANVGIAMGGLGSEGAIESAQIVIMRDNLATIPEAIRIARKTRRVSIGDFWIWGTTNIAGLVLVFSHLIGPAGAAAYNFLSDFLPLLNSFNVKAKIRS